MSRSHRRQSDKGAAAVEFALVLPMLLLVIFGLIDFGRMLNAQITLTEAAREGARANALSSSVSSRVNLATQNLGPAGTVTYTVNQDCAAGADNAQVTTKYTFKFVTPVGAIARVMGGTLGGDLNLTGVGVMPCRG
jgi:Flp pilus assembly protein TadG